MNTHSTNNTPIFSLPNELLIEIFKNIHTCGDQNAFLRTNKFLHAMLNRYLYTGVIDDSKMLDRLIKWIALESEGLDTLSRYLEYGIDVDAVGDSGCTLLCWAAWANGIPSMVHFLLAHGADVNSRVLDGSTVLHTAVRRATDSEMEILKLLIQGGANVNATNNRGDTPLHAILDTRRSIPQMEIVKFLVEAGANVNAANERGETPLHITVTDFPHPCVVQLLLDAGADPNLTTGTGKTPLDLLNLWGDRYECTDIARCMIMQNVDHNAPYE